METLQQALLGAVEKLKDKGIDEPRLEAEVLLGHILGMTRTQLYMNMGAALSQREGEQYRSLIKRRGLREPVSYLTGTKEFMSLEFRVSPAVLIPRPETELLVELIIAEEPATVVDVGTGSGAIAISVARYVPTAEVWAVDISMEALEVAKENALSAGVGAKIQFYHGDLLQPLVDLGLRGVDIIAANLPYIPTDCMQGLPDDVRKYEPALALDGGTLGLDLYYRLTAQAARLLRPGGKLLMEIGYDQGAILKQYFAGLPAWASLEVQQDLSGKDRIVVAVLR